MNIEVQNQIFKDSSDIKVYDNNGTQLSVVSANYNSEGKLTSIITAEGTTYDSSSIKYYKNLLTVPGVGYLRPGTVVKYNNDLYILNFGWHHNISNLTIYSWYLTPYNTDNSVIPCQDYMSHSELPNNTRTVYDYIVNELEEVIV